MTAAVDARYRAEATDPHTIGVAEAADMLESAPWRRFAILGDSLAEGVGAPTPGYRDISWADRVVAALHLARPDLTHLNTGRRAARTIEVLDRQLPHALEFRPELAAVVCGANDMIAEDFSGRVLHGQLSRLVGTLREAGSDVFTYTLQDIATAFPSTPPALRDGIDLLNNIVRDAAVVEMWGHPAQDQPDTYSPDLMHASRRGHAIVAAATVRVLHDMIAARERHGLP